MLVFAMWNFKRDVWYHGCHHLRLSISCLSSDIFRGRKHHLFDYLKERTAGVYRLLDTMMIQVLPLWGCLSSEIAYKDFTLWSQRPTLLKMCRVRMQADQRLPEGQRRHYKGVSDALTKIVREDGVRGLYRGVGPTIARAMALNMGMLASNDEVRSLLLVFHLPISFVLFTCSRLCQRACWKWWER